MTKGRKQEAFLIKSLVVPMSENFVECLNIYLSKKKKNYVGRTAWVVES